MSAEIRFVDVQRRPGIARFLPGQTSRRLVRLLEIWHLGHHRGAGQAQRAQPHETHSDGHHVLHHHPTQDAFLHSQLDFADGAHFIPVRFGLLLTGRGRRESHARHQHSAVSRCVPAARFENFAANVARPATHRQIPSVHLHYEHALHSGDGGHHQLELQGTADPPHAQLDPGGLPEIFAHSSLDETT